MPEFILDHGSPEASQWLASVDPFVRGYVTGMFFTSTGYAENEELEQATVAELATEAREKIVADCTRFQAVNRILLVRACKRPGYTDERAGTDFWYTRNGHGCGYWDRTELEAGDLGDKLTEACRAFGEVYMYRGDDGQIYLA